MPRTSSWAVTAAALVAVATIVVPYLDAAGPQADPGTAGRPPPSSSPPPTATRPPPTSTTTTTAGSGSTTGPDATAPGAGLGATTGGGSGSTSPAGPPDPSPPGPTTTVGQTCQVEVRVIDGVAMLVRVCVNPPSVEILGPAATTTSRQARNKAHGLDPACLVDRNRNLLRQPCTR